MDQYEILKADNSWALQMLVSARMRAGWKPQGGVAYAPGLGFIQAMVFDETRENQTAEARAPEGDPCLAYAAARAASI